MITEINPKIETVCRTEYLFNGKPYRTSEALDRAREDWKKEHERVIPKRDYINLETLR